MNSKSIIGTSEHRKTGANDGCIRVSSRAEAVNRKVGANSIRFFQKSDAVCVWCGPPRKTLPRLGRVRKGSTRSCEYIHIFAVS